MDFSTKARDLLLSWGLALLLSALLVWAGRHWPLPLLLQPWALARPERALQLALALVLLPPLGMGAWLISSLLRHPGGPPANPDRGESSDCAHGER
jgi:hypothetical protein